MRNIIVFGSINTDLIIASPRIPEHGETIKGSGFFISQGGKGANQAMAAAKLGGHVVMIANIGCDQFGESSIASLKENGVDTRYIKRVKDLPSGTAVIIQVESDNRIIIDSGANEVLKVEQLETYLSETKSQGSVFVTQLENNLEETIKALKLAKVNHMTTILNPAPAVYLPQSVYRSVDLLVVNQTEAEILSGIYPNNEADAKQVFEVFRQLGMKSLIITLGKEGSIVIDKDNLTYIKGVSVDVVDTTGAGDAYIGAVAYGLSNGQSTLNSAHLANLVSAFAVTKKGAQAGLPTLEELKIIGGTDHE